MYVWYCQTGRLIIKQAGFMRAAYISWRTSPGQQVTIPCLPVMGGATANISSVALM